MKLENINKQEIVSLAIVKYLLNDFCISSLCDNENEFSIKILKNDNEGEFVSVPNFSELVENGNFEEFIEKYKEFARKAYNIAYGKNIKFYAQDDLDKIENMLCVTSVLNDDDEILVDSKYELIDTRCYLTETTLADFWNYGGIKSLEEELKENCPDVVVSHYKGKKFYLSERLDTYECEYVYITMDDFEYFLNNVDLENYDDKAEFLMDYYKSADSECYDEFYYSETSNELIKQFKEAAEIIETTKKNLEFDSAVDSIIHGEDYSEDVSMITLVEESGIADISVLTSIIDDFRNQLYYIPDEDINAFINNPDQYADNLFYERYIKDNKFKFDTHNGETEYVFEYDFMKVFNEYTEKHCKENYELVFDKEYNSYKIVNLDIDDSYGYHINNIELVFKTEETIDDAIDNLDRRRTWFEAQAKIKKVKEDAIKNADLYSITIKDSYDSGNCVSGTKRFCNLFKLPTDNESKISAKEFLSYIEKSPSELKTFAERTLITAYKRYLSETSI